MSGLSLSIPETLDISISMSALYLRKDAISNIVEGQTVLSRTPAVDDHCGTCRLDAFFLCIMPYYHVAISWKSSFNSSRLKFSAGKHVVLDPDFIASCVSIFVINISQPGTQRLSLSRSEDNIAEGMSTRHIVRLPMTKCRSQRGGRAGNVSSWPRCLCLVTARSPRHLLLSSLPIAYLNSGRLIRAVCFQRLARLVCRSSRSGLVSRE